MSEVSAITSRSVGRVESQARAESRIENRRPEPGVRDADQVEVSSVARYLAQLKGTSGVRDDVVARVRSEIAAGTYDTDARLDSVLDKVLDDLDTLA